MKPYRDYMDPGAVRRFEHSLSKAGLDCEIKVWGKDSGKGGHGRPKVTKVGPLHEFIRDSEYFYDAVLQHIKRCGTCDPYIVLKAYMDRHHKRRFGMSQTMLALVRKYRRAFPDRIPQIVLDEAQVRYKLHDLATETQIDAWELHHMGREELVNLWLVSSVINR